MKIKIISIVSLLILLVLAVALAGCSKPAASAAAGPKGVSDGSEDLIISWQMNVEEADAVNSFSPIAMTPRGKP